MKRVGCVSKIYGVVSLKDCKDHSPEHTDVNKIIGIESILIDDVKTTQGRGANSSFRNVFYLINKTVKRINAEH